MDQQNEGQEPEIIQLNMRETAAIQTHANVRFCAASRLSAEDNVKIQECRRAIAKLMEEGGDHAKVAMLLHSIEYDGGESPFDGAFEQMEMVPWDEAVRMWREGFDAALPSGESMAEENGLPTQVQ